MNPMRDVRVEKVTLNVGCGKDQTRLDKGVLLLKNITGVDPVKTFTSKRIPDWGLRPGLPIGCMITLRKQHANQLLARLLEAKDHKMKDTWFDKEGNFSFGIHEYIDIPSVKYDPKVGMMGLEVCVTLERKGYRIKKRTFKKKKIPARHRISKEDATNFMIKTFKVSMVE